MEDSLGRLVDQLFAFFATHFFEILFILMVLVILDVALFLFSSNKKDKVIILHASWLTSPAVKTFPRLT